ncbi:hypothetical protein BXZ70DRAFT_194835 [Cristinia sonorae]|uniref:Uncharacterized protein n=1 Tax=Cristinia sonorae TaxID=1940300 RepID=A0A8K0XPH3_9AGAR|nr:hypothetical protein BXZ70DRAFT_194835 [Cristinia sonorae]
MDALNYTDMQFALLIPFTMIITTILVSILHFIHFLSPKAILKRADARASDVAILLKTASDAGRIPNSRIVAHLSNELNNCCYIVSDLRLHIFTELPPVTSSGGWLSRGSNPLKKIGIFRKLRSLNFAHGLFDKAIDALGDLEYDIIRELQTPTMPDVADHVLWGAPIVQSETKTYTFNDFDMKTPVDEEDLTVIDLGDLEATPRARLMNLKL